MKRIFLLLFSSFLLASIAACGAAKTVPASTALNSPDPDVAPLLALSQQALQMARDDIPDGILRQVDTDLIVTTFHITDPAATRLVSITIPKPGAIPGDWVVNRTTVNPMLGFPRPGLDLSILRAGPSRVAHAFTSHWPGCQLRGLTLYLEDSRLTWVGFCLISEGEVTGLMDVQTGVFQPGDAPPASFPVTATPPP